MIRPSCTLFAAFFLLLLLAPSAQAISGGSAAIGGPGARPSRVAQPTVQKRLTQGPAWQDFLARRGAAWTARWDEGTGTPIRFSGQGWEIEAERLAQDRDAWALGLAILAEEQALLGGSALPLSDLEPWALDRRDGITTLSFQQRYAGFEVLGARISLRFKQGRFVMGQFESHPGISAPTSPRISADQARDIALKWLDWTPQTSRETAPPGLAILPIPRGTGLDYRLVWRIKLRATNRPSARWVDVDAHSAEPLLWEERVRFLDLAVEAVHDNRYPLAETTTSPMPYAELDVAGTNQGGQHIADMTGAFAYNGSVPADAEWTVGSQWFDIRSEDSQGLQEYEDEISSEGGPLLAAPDPDAGDTRTRRQLAQLDAHIAAHVVRERALAINPEFEWADNPIILRVNMSDENCNAWFDEEAALNFMRRGGGCSNTGRLHDVIYHEYGHGFHWFSVIPGVGGFGDGSLPEGFADYMSATITGDPNLAPNFFVGDSQPLRELEPNRSWPEDEDEDPHITGLIAAGALWDLRVALVAEYGEATGVAIADNLFWHAASRSVETPDVYDEVLLADDDDGNLANGTPHSCLINAAFAPHGMGNVEGGGGFGIGHSPVALLEAGADLEVSVAASVANPECSEERLGSIVLRWTVDNLVAAEGFQSVEQSISGQVEAEVVLSVPKQSAGSYLRYRIELFDETGGLVSTLPKTEITDPWFGAWIGDGETLYFNDFETDDGGLTHELLDGDPNKGADDWHWGTPQGRSGDPTAGASGTKLWGNDLSPADNWNGAYQSDVHNVLRLPAVQVGDLGDARLFLQFQRWLTVEDGQWDQAEIMANGQLVWTQHGSPTNDDAERHHEDDRWLFRSYDITDFVRDGQVAVEWHLDSDQYLEFGGWNVDDLRLLVAIVEDGPGPGPGGDDDDSEGSLPDGGTGSGSSGVRGVGAGCDCAARGRIASRTSATTFASLFLLGGLMGLRRERQRWD